MKLDKATRVGIGSCIVALPSLVTALIMGQWIAPVVVGAILLLVITIIEMDVQRRF